MQLPLALGNHYQYQAMSLLVTYAWSDGRDSIVLIIFSRTTIFFAKKQLRVSSEKNILNSSVESCRVVWSGVVWSDVKKLMNA